MNSNIITIIISICAFIFSIVSWYITTKVSKGQLETEVKKLISERKESFTKYCGEKDKALVINYLIEEELNAYEHGCLLYLNKKLDKKSFKMTYYNEIINLVENGTFNEVGEFSKINCKYENIVKVYKEWTKK